MQSQESLDQTVSMIVYINHAGFQKIQFFHLSQIYFFVCNFWVKKCRLLFCFFSRNHVKYVKIGSVGM